MLKSILGVIVGWVVMAIFSVAIFSCAYLALGAERAFEPESYDVSTIWMALMIAFGFVGGIVGGLVCAAISKSKGACMAFAGIMLALGLITAIMTKMKEQPETVRSGDVPNWAAMMKAQTPTWLCLVNPFVVAGGILLGARMKKPPTG